MPFRRILPVVVYTLLAFAVLFTLPVGVTAQQSQERPAVYELTELNVGLKDTQPPLNLSTPQATLEHLLAAAEAERYTRAAHALNLNLLTPEEQPTQGPELARQLAYLLRQEGLTEWGDVPDRPDGLIYPTGEGGPLTGTPRRDIRLGTLDLNGRDAGIRLQRVQVNEQEPIWVFAPNTVDLVPALYAQYGPGLLEQSLPAWARVQVWGGVRIWEWVALLVFALFSSMVGHLTFRGSAAALGSLSKRSSRALLGGASELFPRPLGVTAGLALFYVLMSQLISPQGPLMRWVRPLLGIALIFAVTWLGLSAIRFLTNTVGRSYISRYAGEQEARHRSYLTYIVVARVVLVAAALFIAFFYAVSQFAPAEEIGVSLLASAGVLSVIIGLAAQPVLGSIIAGILLAFTQPVRIGDSVLFEGQWGWIEDISYTYLTIRTWDKRRIMVPLQHFMANPVENWSKTSAHMMKPVYLYADYRIDVERVRQRFAELLEQSEDWDREVEPVLQVTGVNEETVELRALCSASNPTSAWNLHCTLREQLVAFVRDLEEGQFLPRRRIVLINETGAEANGDDRQRGERNGRQAADQRDGAEQAETSDNSKQPGPVSQEEDEQQPSTEDHELLHGLLERQAGRG